MKYRVVENIFLLAIPCEIREANPSGSAIRIIITWDVFFGNGTFSILVLECTELSL